MSRSAIAVIGLAAAAVLLCMGVGGVIGGIIAADHCHECAHLTDTVYITDTITMHEVRVDTLTRLAYRLVPVSVYDTVTIHDTLYADMPVEFRHWSTPDTADVWYHGIDPALDSVRIYEHVRIVEHTEIVREEAPRHMVTIGASTESFTLGYMMRFGRFSAGVETGITHGGRAVAGARIGLTL